MLLQVHVDKSTISISVKLDVDSVDVSTFMTGFLGMYQHSLFW